MNHKLVTLQLEEFNFSTVEHILTSQRQCDREMDRDTKPRPERNSESKFKNKLNQQIPIEKRKQAMQKSRCILHFGLRLRIMVQGERERKRIVVLKRENVLCVTLTKSRLFKMPPPHTSLSHSLSLHEFKEIALQGNRASAY